jgi:hypothetical protein
VRIPETGLYATGGLVTGFGTCTVLERANGLLCSIASIPAVVCTAIGMAVGVWLCFIGILRPDRWHHE